jgi:hypothetical protein
MGVFSAMLPCSFRLSCKGHHFELAAACQREKETWISSLRESVTVPPTWNNEPLSSLCSDGKCELTSSTLADQPTETISSLPTIQSIPELTDGPDLVEPFFNALPCGIECSKPPKLDVKTGSDSPYHMSPSRRSSTASVKAIFSPLTADPNTIVIRRSLQSARLQVDHGLHDVISKPCVAARSHASMHDEELFQAPKSTRSSFSRSSSGLSMAGAMGAAAKSRLSKHESLRVPRRRSIADAHGISGELDSFSREAKKRTIRTKPLASKRSIKTPIVVSKSAGDDEKRNSLPSPWDALSDSPIPLSQRSSRSMSDPSSTLVSPALETIPLSLSSANHNETTKQANHVHEQSNHRPKRTRSMVDSVRSLFHSRQTSLDRPVTDSLANDPHSLGPLSFPTLNPGLLKRWTIGSLHRRARSASDVPKAEQLLSTSSSVESSGPDSNITVELDSEPLSDAADRMPAYHIPSPMKRQSLRVSTIRRSSSPDYTHSSSVGLQKKLSFLRRLKVVDTG